MPPIAPPWESRMLRRLQADPSLATAIADMEERRSGPSRFGSNGLKLDGRLFALFTRGTLVVKLPATRVATLVAAKLGVPFDPGHGRKMKEWLEITSTRAPLLQLAQEAYAFATRTRSMAR
jgi:hypothetical protein